MYRYILHLHHKRNIKHYGVASLVGTTCIEKTEKIYFIDIINLVGHPSLRLQKRNGNKKRN